jgi:hypothetical protein
MAPCRLATLRAGLTKAVHPHTLRHSSRRNYEAEPQLMSGYAGMRQRTAHARQEMDSLLGTRVQQP